MAKEQELSVLAFLIRKPDLLWEFSKALDEVHFEYKQAGILFRLLKSIFFKYKEMPTEEELLWKVRQHSELRTLPLLVRESLELTVAKIYQKEVTDVTGERVASFILSRERERTAQMLDALTDVDIEKAPESLTVIQENLEKMRLLVTKKNRDGQSMPFEDEALDDVQEYVMEGYGGEPISTGFPKLDYRTHGGFHRGEFNLFVGATGIGKTLFGTSMCSDFLRRGLSVVYYALDNSMGDMRKRFFASVTGIPYHLDMSLKEWTAQVQEASTSMRNQKLQLVIQHYPARSVSIADLRINLKQTEGEMHRRASSRGESFNGVDVVLIDYVDLLQTEKHYREPRHGLQEITQNCMGLAQSMKNAVIGLSQTNVGGLTMENPGLENLAEAYSKSWPAALVGLICQTDAEYNDNLCRLFFPKARNGPKNFIIPMEMNYGNYRVRERVDVEGVYQVETRTPRRTSNIERDHKPLPIKNIQYGGADGPTG